MKKKIQTYLSKGDITLVNDNTRVSNFEKIYPPISFIEKYPISQDTLKFIENSRKEVNKIINNDDDRLLVVIGPCSIHDPEAAMEYANKLKKEIDKHNKDLLVIMRVYFEKPRTTVGWKGLINDPYLDNSFAINDGLDIARKLLTDINTLKVATAGEFLDLVTPQYTADLMSWGAIGARTTESQLHRELASGISCAVGFKNSTNGSVQIAIDAMTSASYPHRFIGIDKFAHSTIVQTTGNPDVHVILRGGNDGPNYSAEHVKKACEELAKLDFVEGVMVDCSHANCNKNFKVQLDVAKNIAEQISQGSTYINSVMIESNIIEGKQAVKENEPLCYGQSITDPCLGWEDTEVVLDILAKAVQERRKKN